MELSLSSCKNSGGDICSDRSPSGLEYADAVVVLNEDPIKLQVFSIAWTIVQVSLRRVLHVQVWSCSKPNLILTGEQLVEVDRSGRNIR